MATYRYNSFKFPAAALKGVDADCVKGLRSFLSSRETAINTITTSSFRYCDGPFAGQVVELCGMSTFDIGTLDINVNGWIGRYSNGEWHGTTGKPVTVHESTGEKAKVTKAKTGKGFTLFEQLLCELAEPIEDRKIFTDVMTYHRFIYGRQDDFGDHIYGRDGRPAIYQDDFGDTFVYENEDGRYELCKTIVSRAVYTIGRTTFKVLPTEQGIDNLRARLIKARKWFADKYFIKPEPVIVAPVEPDVDLLGDTISIAASADVEALVAIAAAQCTAIEDTADTETVDLELVTCETESSSAEHGASAGSANPSTVDSHASTNVIFADFRPVKPAENPAFTGDDVPADTPSAVSTDTPTTQSAEIDNGLMDSYYDLSIGDRFSFYKGGSVYIKCEPVFESDGFAVSEFGGSSFVVKGYRAICHIYDSEKEVEIVNAPTPEPAASAEPVQVAQVATAELIQAESEVVFKSEGDRIRHAADNMRDKFPDIAAKYDDLALSHDLRDERKLAESTGWTIDKCEAELKAQQANNRPTIQSKSGAYCAWFYMLASGAFGLRFAVAGQDDIYADFETWHDRMVAVQLMGSAIDNPTDNPPAGEKPENGAPEPAQDAENTAVGAVPGTGSAVSSEAQGVLSAVSSDFSLVETFKKNPLALLAQGMTVNELVGLGVHYPGHMSSASDDGAVTSVDDSRGQRFGGLRLHCTLEDGRVVIAEPHYFEDDIRPIMQFNGKRHGDEYLSQLLSGAAMRKASESSAVEQAAKDHAQALIDLVGQYPQLTKSENKHAGGKLAASNARILLKAAFKGQKFSVRSDYNSMRIEWIDGPTSDQVNDVVGMFDIGASDSQSDYFYKEHTAFSDLFGGVQYLNTRREFSDGMVQQAIDTLYPDAAKRPPLSDWRKAEGAFSFGYSDEWARSRMNEILNSTSAYKPKAK